MCDGAALSHVKRRSVVVLFTIAGATLLLCVAHIVVGWFLLLQQFMKSLRPGSMCTCVHACKQAISTNQATSIVARASSCACISVQCLRLPEALMNGFVCICAAISAAISATLVASLVSVAQWRQVGAGMIFSAWRRATFKS